MNFFKKIYVIGVLNTISFHLSLAQSNLIPPGTLKIHDSLFMDTSPVTNMMYYEFLKELERTNPNGLETMSIPRHLKIEGKSVKTYFLHPKYQHFPVLQITKYQADLYCKWRSDMAQLFWDSKYPDNRKTLLYSLPTLLQYENAVKVFKYRSMFQAYQADNPLELKIKKYPKTEFVTYNISEITSDDSYFGDNWKSETQIKLPNTYTGFRCICEVTIKYSTRKPKRFLKPVRFENHYPWKNVSYPKLLCVPLYMVYL